MIVIAIGKRLECSDCLCERNERSIETSEDLGHEGVLREEALDTTSTTYENAILFGKFVDTKNCDDVLKILLTLQDLLRTVSDTEVLFTDVARIKNA